MIKLDFISKLLGEGKVRRDRIVRLSAVAVLVLGAAAYLLASNVAYAVSVDGDFVGYARSVEEVNSAVDSVAATASSVLGYEYAVESEVDCRLALAQADESVAASVEEKLLDNIEDIGEYAIVCVDGTPVCAFETSAAASAALSEYIASFTDGNTVSARFREEVSVVVDYADTALLAVAENFAAVAAEMITLDTVSEVVEYEDIPYETRYIEDETLFEDEQVVVTNGLNGRRRLEKEIKAVNGEVTETSVLVSFDQTQPVEEVIRQGTRVRLSTGSYIWPTEGLITSYFGYRNIGIGSTYHQGMDIAGPTGTPIVAADGGTVIRSGEWGGFGLMMIIEHDNGDHTYYAHCSSLLKKVGETVEQGELIARMGSTGVSTGSHLHFEYRPGGETSADPLEILN